MEKASWKCKILPVIFCLGGENLLRKMKPKLYSNTERKRKIGTQIFPYYDALCFKVRNRSKDR